MVKKLLVFMLILIFGRIVSRMGGLLTISEFLLSGIIALMPVLFLVAIMNIICKER